MSFIFVHEIIAHPVCAYKIMSIRKGDNRSALFLNVKIERGSLTGVSSKNTFGSNKIMLALIERSVAEVNFSPLASSVE